jgi:predicted nucleic acid-binding Zn ribbon protein
VSSDDVPDLFAADPPQGGAEGQLPEPDTAVDHDAEGLDLARALTRAVARLGGTPARKRTTRQRRTGEQGRVSGAHPDERDPQLLDATLHRLVDDHGWDLSLRVHGVFGRWSQIVGEEIAQHCEPESFADGKLTVRTDSTAWATQLRLLAPTLVRRLNEELGHGTVTVIEVLGPNVPSWKKGRRSVRGGRGPRDTYG